MGPLYNREEREAERPSRWTGFAPSSPLFLAAAALFIGSYAVWRFDPSAGPGLFPLWDLLVVLGFVATIGGVLSWFYAAGDGVPEEVVSAPVPEPEAARPVRTRPRTLPPLTAPRADVGRPPPAVVGAPRRAAGHASGFSAALATTPRNPPPWDEPEDLEARPVPLPTPPVEPIPRTEVEQMLRELDGIARDASRRPPPTAPSSY